MGEAAPAGPLPRLSGTGTGSLADYRGRWVLVNFWASWCIPCRQEAPALERFQRMHGGPGFTVLGIDTRDLSGDGQNFVRQYGLTYPQLRDGDGQRAHEFGTHRRPGELPGRPAGQAAFDQQGAGRRGIPARIRRPDAAGRRLVSSHWTRRRWPAAAANALALTLAMLIAPAGAAAAQARTTLNDIEGEVMCPICGTLLELADSPQAQREKVFVARLIAKGKTRTQVKDALVAQYGAGCWRCRRPPASTSPPTWSR